MALSPAEKMRAYRERQKANNQKQVSFLIDADIAETVTNQAKQHKATQADIFNNLLRQALSGNKLPSNDTVTSYQKEIDKLNAMAENCYQCANWTGDKCSKGLVLTGFVCNGFESLRAELAAAKARVIELLNVDDKVFSFVYSGNDWTIRKDIDKRWHYKKGNAFALAPEFIQQATISNTSGVWVIDMGGQKIEMATI